MPQYKYNPRTGTMEPVKRTGVECSKRMGGVMVEDFDRHVQFLINHNDSLSHTANIHNGNVKIFNRRDAMKIADYMKRVQPRSKYTDFRYFALGFAMPENEQLTEVHPNDIALIESLIEEYGLANVIDAINEDSWFDVERHQSAEGNTDGKKEHGMKGFVKALPSAIISAVICWPLALTRLVGALHIRAEERWKHSMLNPARWRDFIETPNDQKSGPEEGLISQKEFDKKTKREKDAYLDKLYVENNRFYYAVLSNNEVIRVVGTSSIDAKEMALGIVKAIQPKYDDLNRRISASDSVHTYRVYLDDGEVALWSGTNERSVAKEVVDSRNIINKYYQEQGWIKELKKGQVLKTYLPAAKDIDDLGTKMFIEKPIADNAHIQICEDAPRNLFDGNDGDEYRIDDIDFASIVLRVNTVDDLKKIFSLIKNNDEMNKVMVHNEHNAANIGSRGHNVKAFLIKMQSGDVFKLFIDESDIENKVWTACAGNPDLDAHEEYAKLVARKIEELISKTLEGFYRGTRTARNKFGTRATSVDNVKPLTRAEYPSSFYIPSNVTAHKISDGGEDIGEPIAIAA